ncbi:MAG: ABC transporter ATP-binding protein [Myxococcaceae bacterium]|nr:ABC transporter ATP-binding protein [Myxococcaceae bacterium]
MTTIALRGISKRFGTQLALDDVSLELKAGERVAVVGENGAGKSSLMNVLYGLYAADRGEVHVDGRAVRIRTPADALALGIGMVHQHFTLVPTLTVVENVVLGREPTRLGLLDAQRARHEVQATCARFGFSLELDARVDTLTVGSQQKVEIVKALHRGVRTLILDEPTAVLTPQEADELFSVTRRLSDEGLTVVLISHKLREVLAFATRVAVLRRGTKVAEVAATAATPESLAELMVGPRAPSATASDARPTDVVAALVRVSAGKLRDVSCVVRAGEVLGIAGVDGNGQRELAEVLTGLRVVDGGTLTVLGEASKLTPGLARALGVAHVPEDRLKHAVVTDFSVAENVALGRQRRPPFAKGPRIDVEGRLVRTTALLEAHDVRPRAPGLRVGALSGGNQQKLVVGRELDGAPKLLVAVQPTRGLDLAAVDAVRARLLAFRASGGAVVLVSLDLDEVLALADRLLVLHEGRVTGEFSRGAFDERLIGQRMLGVLDA